MPALNAEKTIQRAIRSTLKSLRKGDELLIFDDGSSDSTRMTALAIEDSRIRVFGSATTNGVAYALNYLVSQARGSLIARMDADDVCLTHRFWIQRLFIAAGYDLVFSNALLFWGLSKTTLVLPYPWFWIGYKNFQKYISIHNFGIHPTALGRAEIFKQLTYKPRADEDHDLWIRATNAGFRLTRISIPTVALRQHAGQITKSEAWIQLHKNGTAADSAKADKGLLPLWLRLEMQGPRRLIRKWFPID